MTADQLYVHQVGGADSVTLVPDSVRFLPAFLVLIFRQVSSLCTFAFVFFLSGTRLLFLAPAAVTHRIVVSCCSFVHFAMGSPR